MSNNTDNLQRTAQPITPENDIRRMPKNDVGHKPKTNFEVVEVFDPLPTKTHGGVSSKVSGSEFPKADFYRITKNHRGTYTDIAPDTPDGKKQSWTFAGKGDSKVTKDRNIALHYWLIEKNHTKIDKKNRTEEPAPKVYDRMFFVEGLKAKPA